MFSLQHLEAREKFGFNRFQLVVWPEEYCLMVAVAVKKKAVFWAGLVICWMETAFKGSWLEVFGWGFLVEGS